MSMIPSSDAHGSIELFVNNYKHDGAKLITGALYRIRPAKDDAHSLAWDVVGLSNRGVQL